MTEPEREGCSSKNAEIYHSLQSMNVERAGAESDCRKFHYCYVLLLLQVTAQYLLAQETKIGADSRTD